jgi:hypothetical protein
MKTQRQETTTRRTFCSRALAVTATALLPSGGNANRAQEPGGLSPNARVIVTGLDNPRGLKFGPDGRLYVAEGGRGGPLSTDGQCEQVPPPIGPYTGGYTARISRVDVRRQTRETLVDGLPSSTNSTPGADTLGVADVAFLGDTLYGLMAGAGCSHGLAGTTNGVLRVNRDGTTTQIADLSTFQMTHPVAHPHPDDFEPDGTWYSLIAVGGNLYALEPNHGELDRITPIGHDRSMISRVVDISASQGHIVPTAMAYRNGHFFVGNLSTFPVPDNSVILKIPLGGRDVEVIIRGLTTVLGVLFDDDGRLYVLESFTGHPFPSPDAAGTGRVLRFGWDGQPEIVASGLSFPAAMTFGPDELLYVSNKGFSSGPGAGEVVRIRVC